MVGGRGEGGDWGGALEKAWAPSQELPGEAAGAWRGASGGYNSHSLPIHPPAPSCLQLMDLKRPVQDRIGVVYEEEAVLRYLYDQGGFAKEALCPLAGGCWRRSHMVVVVCAWVVGCLLDACGGCTTDRLRVTAWGLPAPPRLPAVGPAGTTSPLSRATPYRHDAHVDKGEPAACTQGTGRAASGRASRDTGEGADAGPNARGGDHGCMTSGLLYSRWHVCSIFPVAWLSARACIPSAAGRPSRGNDTQTHGRDSICVRRAQQTLRRAYVGDARIPFLISCIYQVGLNNKDIRGPEVSTPSTPSRNKSPPIPCEVGLMGLCMRVM